ncbi:MAG: 1,4-dihydroxy-2-naphthoate octaprenyltransferase [Bacteroidia bacterium]
MYAFATARWTYDDKKEIKMGANVKIWIEAIRPRTLLLSISCIGMGLIAAYSYMGFIESIISFFTILTALLLQILSNLANDYGDSIHGADSDKRKGPSRAVQAGMISKEQMKKSIYAVSVLTLVSGIYLLTLCIDTIGLKKIIILFLAGIAAIAAAIYYTNGKKPYGYSGFGDISVFVFFGLLAVAGTYFLQTGFWQNLVLLPAAAMGLLATGVLNINNMRDIESDKLAGKHSIPVRLGYKNAKIYHYFLIVSALILIQIYASKIEASFWFMLPYPLFLAQLLKIKKIQNLQNLDPLLKELSISTFLLVLLFAVSVMYA